jgi:hypothetical protein
MRSMCKGSGLGFGNDAFAGCALGRGAPTAAPAFLAGITGGEATEAPALGAGTGLEDDDTLDTG